MSYYYYIRLFLYIGSINLECYCDANDIDDEVIEADYKLPDDYDTDIKLTSIEILAGKYAPHHYEIAINICDFFLKQLGCQIDLSDFKEKIKNKFFSKDISQ